MAVGLNLCPVRSERFSGHMWSGTFIFCALWRMPATTLLRRDTASRAWVDIGDLQSDDAEDYRIIDFVLRRDPIPLGSVVQVFCGNVKQRRAGYGDGLHLDGLCSAH